MLLNDERLNYWLSVGAKPSENVNVFIKKYGSKGTQLDEQTGRPRAVVAAEASAAGTEPVFVFTPKPAEPPKPRPRAKRQRLGRSSAGRGRRWRRRATGGSRAGVSAMRRPNGRSRADGSTNDQSD